MVPLVVGQVSIIESNYNATCRGWDMNKKILLGSIIAVAILIGVSFTSVVGFHEELCVENSDRFGNLR